MITLSAPVSGVLQIKIDRGGRRNAIDADGFRQLAAAWDELEQSDARVGIITGAGGDFSSGADLASISREVAAANREGGGGSIWAAIHRAVLRDQNLQKPVVSAIEGICFGAGMELAGATDIRIASRSARFALPEVRHGVVASGGSLARLPRQVPYAVAMEILLTGEEKSAADMERWGFLNRVVEDGAALSTALELAQRIADNAPAAVRATKRTVALGFRDTLMEAYEIERATEAEVMRGDEAREGARAFAERRSPSWRLTGQ
ncbi:enoyl-CoA hydratase/isomerase family protein [Microbacterium sp. A84]|uniref:enoyl-CoA hydratase/isomerase family protein n=1 Tax=Microbacterium sp. A84 TaxID=3450715 RepID=UPI003F42896B